LKHEIEAFGGIVCFQWLDPYFHFARFASAYLAAMRPTNWPRSLILKNRSRRQPVRQDNVDSLRRPEARPGAFPTRGAPTIHQSNLASISVGRNEPAGVEVSLGKRALAFKATLLGLRAAEEDALLGRFR
jgi:hypothetical protein